MDPEPFFPAIGVSTLDELRQLFSQLRINLPTVLN
jgi:hypothetical protein